MSNGRTSQATSNRVRPTRKPKISFQFKPTAKPPTEAQNIIKRRSSRFERWCTTMASTSRAPRTMSLHHLGINALGVKALRRRNVNIAVSPKSNDRSHEGRRNGISINPISTSIFEPLAPYTQAQNGTAERSGGAIIEKARAMRIAANLPHDLWNEIVNCVVYFWDWTP